MVSEQVRIDKWLWAARFFKTRGLARAAIQGGKVHLNNKRVKPSRPLRVGDQLRIVRGEEVFELRVVELDDRRGPATRAAQMFDESEKSLAARKALAEQRQMARAQDADQHRRPDKRQRRQIIRFRNRQNQGQEK